MKLLSAAYSVNMPCMVNNNRPDKMRSRKGFGKREFYKPRFGGGRDEGRSDMFSAICATCGKECEVPFKPSGNKPVYCRECYTKQDKPSNRPFIERKEITKSQNNKQLDAIERKLDKILSLLTQTA